MKHSTDAEYFERCSFQQMLDKAFPRGAMCALLEGDAGHLQASALLGSTGRLFCSDARRRASNGGWEYEVLIDSRRSEEPQGDPTRVWITAMIRNAAVAGLWEAEVLGESDQLLRVNANPPAAVRPSRRMRSAVTKVYETALFPTGLYDITQEPVPSA